MPNSSERIGSTATEASYNKRERRKASSFEGSAPPKRADRQSDRGIVLDSSAIASLFFKDKFQERITRVIEGGGYSSFHTLDIACAEVGTVAWKSIVLFKQPSEPIHEALRLAVSFISDNCIVLSSKENVLEALEIGTKYGIQVYDSMFLALAKKLRLEVLTTDEKLVNKVRGIKELRETVLQGF